MSDQNHLGLRKISRALISVSDKTGIVDFARDLRTFDVEIISTGGTAKAVRDNPEHVAAMNQNGIEPIDMVVIDLYPFAQTVRREGVTEAEAIEQIDIGGPAMIRSAAKNAQDVAVIVRPEQYSDVLAEMVDNSGGLSLKTRRSLAQTAFTLTAMYDMKVCMYLAGGFRHRETGITSNTGGSATNNIFSVGR